MLNRCDRDDHRGNSETRRRRKAWLLSPEACWGGDGETVPCWECGVLCGPDDVDLCADRIIPGERGGGYDRGNIAPHCSQCSSRQGNARTQVKRMNRASTKRVDEHVYLAAAV